MKPSECKCNCEPRCCTLESIDIDVEDCSSILSSCTGENCRQHERVVESVIVFEPEFDITIHQMNRKEIEEQYSDTELLFADGFDDAIVGVSQQFNSLSVAYNKNKCIEILMTRDKMSREEAMEYFEYNIVGAYVGQHTPSFIER